MWQSSSQKLRALQDAKKRRDERLKRPMHIRRVRAEIKINNSSAPHHTTEVRVLLNDLTQKGVGIFSSAALPVGQEVCITLEEPKKLSLQGKIIWCEQFETSHHVISVSPFSFRMGIKFIFTSSDEEQMVSEYCNELAKDPYLTPAA